MERTQLQPLVISGFEGINQLVDDTKVPPSFVPWASGCFLDDTKSHQRIKGKKPYLSNTTHGSILCIKQLTFTSKNVVMIQAGTALMVSTSLASLRVVEASSINPTQPNIWGER